MDWPGLRLPEAAAGYTVDGARPTPALDLDYLAEVLRTTLAKEPLLSTARIERHDERLLLALPEMLLFAPGTTDVSAAASAALARLTPTLRGIANRLVIDGHSDPDAVGPAGPYASNWELSLARALAVAHALTAAGLDRPIECYGFADSRYN